MPDFLVNVDAAKGRWRDIGTKTPGFAPQNFWSGHGRDAIEVAYAIALHKPTITDIRDLWRYRHGRSAAPLLLVVSYPTHPGARAMVCGPAGEAPVVVDLDLDQADRLARAALSEPNRHLATAMLVAALEHANDAVPGLHNRGLLATHELVNGVPTRTDWAAALAHGHALLDRRSHDLIRGLGYRLEHVGQHHLLRSQEGNARAIAVFLQDEEQPDAPSFRYELQTPASYALAQADRENLPWVITVRGSSIRLYSTSTSGAAGQRGRTETFVELDLALLPSDRAGYLHLLFSSAALARDGVLAEIQLASRDFTSGLSERLRERVYGQAVPRLALAIARQVGGTAQEDLERHYRTTLTILFRMLFIAYAEDSKLLPLHVNGDYTDHSLKQLAHRLAEAINAGRDLGFDDPLNGRQTEHPDQEHDDLWRTCVELFEAVDKGHTRWGVPAYNGGLFSSDPSVNPVGAIIDGLRLTNADLGPALASLIIDRSPDGLVGPIDFRSLSVREFGTIYEGLLESELSVADQDLKIGKDGAYLPARAVDLIEVLRGDVYLHNRSGQRKSTGSYFTKPFAVDHLLERAVVPTLEEHLERVRQLLEAGREADATDALFDFRVADIAMGSGHFLTAVVDRVEAHVSRFLGEHPLPPVLAELDLLRRHAMEALGDHAPAVEIETASLLRRLIARRCVYGVDINPISVELARVSMWIHTFVPGLPLSYLNHNLVVGDSLSGISTIEEATTALLQHDGHQPGMFDDPLREALKAAQEPLVRLARIVDATPQDITAARETADEIRRAVSPVEAFFDVTVAVRIGHATRPAIAGPEDLLVLTGHPARSVVRILGSLHFPVAFPEVFLRKRPGFDVVVGNPPWEEVVVEERSFWARHIPGLKAMEQADALRAIEKTRRDRPDLVAALQTALEQTGQLRALLAVGPFPGMGTGDPDLYKAFCWRFAHLTRQGGAIGVVLPRSVFTALGSSEWRRSVLPSSHSDITTLRNAQQWIFDDVNPGYTICLLAVRNVGQATPGSLELHGRYGSHADLVHGSAQKGARILVPELEARDSSLAVPDLGSDRDAHLFAVLLAVQAVSGRERSDFCVRPARELDATIDRKQSKILRTDGNHPVFNHTNIGHFTFGPESGEFILCDWDETVRALTARRRASVKRRASVFADIVSAKGRRWIDDSSTLSVKHPRIAFRDVVHASNRRKVWAALIPSRVVLTNTAPYLIFARGDLMAQAYLLGILGSSPCDWYAQLFVGLHLNFFIFNALPVPIGDFEDPRCVRIARIAATLAITNHGDYGEFKDLMFGDATSESERSDLIAELDALASLLYGLDDDLLDLIWRPAEPLRPDLDTVRWHRERWS